MVAECKNCQTKFRFDETLIGGEGVWVRCNQCKHVFFLDNANEAGTASLDDRESGRDTEDMKEPASDYKRATQGQIMLDQKEDMKERETVTVGDIEKEVGDIGKHRSVETENVQDNRPGRNKITEEKAGTKPVASHIRQVVYLLIGSSWGVLILPSSPTPIGRRPSKKYSACLRKARKLVPRRSMLQM